MNYTDRDSQEYSLQKLAIFFSVLGDTGRVKIINTLLGGELCVNHLSEAVEMSQSAVSHQLKVLKTNNIVKARRDGKNVFYSLDDEHIRDIFEIGLNHVCHTHDPYEEE